MNKKETPVERIPYKVWSTSHSSYVRSQPISEDEQLNDDSFDFDIWKLYA